MKFSSGLELDDFDRLLTMDVHASHFSSEWLHCDQIANFVGSALASEEPDSFRYGNLVSTIANELLESVYWQNSKDGVLRISVIQKKPYLGFIMTVPVQQAQDDFFKSFMKRLDSSRIKLDYQELLSSKDEAVSGLHGLMELLASYEAQFLYLAPSAEEKRAIMALAIDIQEALRG